MMRKISRYVSFELLQSHDRHKLRADVACGDSDMNVRRSITTHSPWAYIYNRKGSGRYIRSS